MLVICPARPVMHSIALALLLLLLVFGYDVIYVQSKNHFNIM